MKVFRRVLTLAVLAGNLLLLLPADGQGVAAPRAPVALAFPSAPSHPPARRSPHSIVFVGASLMAGWFASEGRDFPALVAHEVGASGPAPAVQRLAEPGARAADALHWRLPAHASLIVVHLVGNDAGAARPTPLAAFESAYTTLLERLRAASPQARIVCLGSWLDPNELNRMGVPVRAYDAAVAGACSAVGGRFVALGSVFVNPAYHGPAGRHVPTGVSDTFHANDAGHAEIARLVLEQAFGLEPPPRLSLGARE